MRAVASPNNFFLVPDVMTIQQLFDLTGFTSIFAYLNSGPGGAQYYFKKPKYSLLPDQYPNNASDTNPTSTAISSLFQSTQVYFPFNQIDVEYISIGGTDFVNDVSTTANVFNIFPYTSNLSQGITITINGVQASTTPFTGALPSHSPNSSVAIGSYGYVINITEPVNNIKVSFVDPFDSKRIIVSEFVLRYYRSGYVPSPYSTYFWGGVFFQELSSSGEANLLYSYSAPGAGIGYTDAYGVYIAPGTVSVPLGTVLTGPLSQTLTLSGNSITYFGKNQCFWQAPSGSNPSIPGSAELEFSKDGYLRLTRVPVGTYIYYPTTVGGHITLTIIVTASGGGNAAVSLPTQYTFYTIPGAPINLAKFNITAPDTTVSSASIASNILTATRTISFSAGTLNFNVNVINIPASYPLSLKVEVGQPYNLSTLLGLDPKIDPGQLVGISSNTNDNGSSNLNPPPLYNQTPPNSFIWSTAGSTGNAIYAGYYDTTNNTYASSSILVANVEAISLPYVSPPNVQAQIVTRVGDKFYIQQYIVPHHNDTIIVSVIPNGTNVTSSSVSSESNGLITINDSGVTSITVNLVIIGVSITLLFDVLLLSANSTVCFMSRDFTYFVPSTNIDVTLSNGRVVSLSSTGIQSYTGDEVSILYSAGFSNPSPGNGKQTIVASATPGFLFSKLLKAIVVKTLTTGPVCYDLLPFQTFSSNPMTVVKDQNSNVTLTLPSQPEYKIYNKALTSELADFFGGTTTLAVGTNDDLVIEIPEYNDGTFTIPVQVVQGSRKNIFLVNQIVIGYLTRVLLVRFLLS